MAQIFPRGANSAAKVSIVGAAIAAGALLTAAYTLDRGSFTTNVGIAPDQPVPFSHKHHVTDDGIDCRYCHTTVETSHFAGIPATEICMSCHSQIWKESPMLAPVRDSYRTGKPLVWTRVHDLPDFVYFNHSIHVAKGIGCESCHGRVDRMPLMRRAHTLQMSWCLECHGQPEEFVRDRTEIYKFGEPRPTKAREHGLELVREYGIDSKQLLDCWICHR